MIKELTDRAITIKTPYSGLVTIVPYKGGNRIGVYYRFHNLVKARDQKFVFRYCKVEGFVEQAKLESA